MKVHPIRPGFLGLSIEYPSIEPYAGTDPSDINPTLINLIRNITPNQSPVIRIGGDSSDWEWWPVPGMTRPGGVKYTLTPTWVAVTKALAQQLNARLILGLDLEANSLKLAATEAAHFVDGIGPSSIEAFEPGNEPELYGSWPWYVAPGGRRVHGRPASWSIGDYARQVVSLRRTLDATARTVPHRRPGDRRQDVALRAAPVPRPGPLPQRADDPPLPGAVLLHAAVGAQLPVDREPALPARIERARGQRGTVDPARARTRPPSARR